MVYAMSRYPGTTSYDTWASKKLYSNNPQFVPGSATWSVWDPVKLATGGDRIQWLWINGHAAIDQLKVTRKKIECTPSTALIGQTVSCSVGAKYEVSRWEFYMDGEPPTTAAAATSSDGEAMALTTLDDAPTVEWISTSKTWAGPVGRGGTVRAYVTDPSGGPQILTTQFQVISPASQWQLTWKYRRGTTAPVKLTVPNHDPDASMGGPGRSLFGMNCPEESCALSRRIQPDVIDSTAKGFTALHVQTGTNSELWFV
ncbi:MAG TPA: hypothetical protein VEB59_09170, partial [Gemmatimonadales bacterium]|nr:hypothetical protein [Gemmatimonadales bacterium]